MKEQLELIRILMKIQDRITSEELQCIISPQMLHAATKSENVADLILKISSLNLDEYDGCMHSAMEDL